MPDRVIVVRESEWREMREALKQIAAETHGTVDDPDASRINRIARRALAHPAPQPSGRVKPLESPDTQGPYEARFVDGGMPTACCEYGVISLSEGREVCRVWREQDARAISAALSALTAGKPVPEGGDDG